ncbi:15347_t:CDS:2, partial [Racocetra fulgida]
QWNTLDGTWNKRFIQAGKELLDLTLGEAFESKLQVQITYEKETLLTFDESGKFFGRQLRLPYNKEATSSDDKRAFDSTLDSDLISPVGAKKIKSCKGDVNVEKANGDSAIKMTSTAYQQFTNKYQKIPKEDKWTLSTEKIVEDALYVFGMKCSHEHYASSNRKNSQRVVASTDSMKRKAMGRRGDLIIRKWHTEYGCSEAGKIFEGINGTKIIKEGGLKMPKMLRDMFIDLCKTMEMRKNKIRRLETVGYHCCDWIYQRGMSVDCHGHGFLRCQLKSLNSAIVKNVIKLMEEEDLTEEEQLKMLQNCDESGFTTPPPRLQLMSSSVTPESKRMNKNDEE